MLVADALCAAYEDQRDVGVGDYHSVADDCIIDGSVAVASRIVVVVAAAAEVAGAST